MKLVVCVVLATCIAVLFAVSPGCSSIKWKSVSQGGSGHTIAVRDDGTLWAWGDNRDQQLGDSNTSNHSSTPKQIGNDKDWMTVSVGLYHSLAIKEDGSLWGWGNNDFSQLGTNVTKKLIAPSRIGNESEWIAVEGGDWHTIALKKDGTLWGCGKNADGQLGNDTKTNQVNLTQIGTESDWAAISLGFSFTLALKKNGSLYGWGKNQYFQLGNNVTSRDVLVPTLIGNSTWKSISAGLHGSAGIQTDGTLWIWGCGYFKDCKDLIKEPIKLDASTNWKSVVMTDYAGLALKEDGTFWAWGSNYYGQLGDGEIGAYRKELAQVGNDSDWESIHAGQTFTFATKKTGRFLSFGGNTHGQLGFGHRKEYEKYGMPSVCADGLGCGNNICSQCPMNHGLLGFECHKCEANQFVNSQNRQRCDNCSESCLTCNGTSATCTTCKVATFMTANNTCEQCHEKCSSCSHNATFCTTCSDKALTLTADGQCVNLSNITVLNGSGIPTWFIILVVVKVLLAGLIGYCVGFKRAQKQHMLADRLTDKELEM